MNVTHFVDSASGTAVFMITTGRRDRTVLRRIIERVLSEETRIAHMSDDCTYLSRIRNELMAAQKAAGDE